MTEENVNITVINNASTIKEVEGVEVFYSYPQDIEIIKTLKKLPYNVSSVFYEENKLKSLSKSTIVFNLCDAFTDPEDEINLIQSLEKYNIPYTGCSSFTTKLCQDKFALKKVFENSNINCPKGQLFKNSEEKLNQDLKFPLILKLIGEDGSFGLEEDSVTFDEEQLRKKLSQLFLKFNKNILADEYIDGREFNVPVVGNENPEVLAILEIDYSEHFEGKPKILTYKAKWSKNSLDFKNTYSFISKLNNEEREKISSLAISAYKSAKCTGYASVDLRMDDKGNVFVIEVNSNCYIAPESDMLKAAVSRGLSYEQLLDKIINYAAERFSLQKELVVIKE